MSEFYEELDKIFNSLLEKYEQDTDDIRKYKYALIEAFENERGNTSKYILDKIKPKNFNIDNNGKINKI